MKITMSRKERDRLVAIRAVDAGQITQEQAAQLPHRLLQLAGCEAFEDTHSRSLGRCSLIARIPTAR